MAFNMYHNLPELARNGGFVLCDGDGPETESIDWRFIGEFFDCVFILMTDNIF